MPADLKHAFEEMLKSLVLGCQAPVRRSGAVVRCRGAVPSSEQFESFVSFVSGRSRSCPVVFPSNKNIQKVIHEGKLREPIRLFIPF